MAGKRGFKLQTIHQIGKLAEDFDALLAAAVADCKSRPGMTKPREITLKVIVTPSTEDERDVVVKSLVGAKTPGRGALPYLMQATAKNELMFNPDSPIDPDQGTMFDED
jgi:hypothetical protein